MPGEMAAFRPGDGPADGIPTVLVPRPKQFRARAGVFRHAAAPVVFNSLENEGLPDDSMRLALGGSVRLADRPSPRPPDEGLRLFVGDPRVESESSEAYRLVVEARRVTITGRTIDGVLMGLRTLAQLALDGPIPCCQIADWPDMTMRGAHLCYHLIREGLAYSCPNFKALMAQVDRLASLKHNAVLLELESLFPYKRHPAASCKIAFTDEQIAALRRRLAAHRMEIIPLVQCLGHAYNVLTDDAYAEFRELPTHIQQYCPTNPKVADLYMEFVEEYLQAFPGITTWHIGGDESRMLGRCPRCKAKVKKLGKSRLYVDHVAEIARRLHQRGLTPLIWSDMLIRHSEAIDRLPQYVGIVYWNYSYRPGRKYDAGMFLTRGRRVVGAHAVRYGTRGTELSVYYRGVLGNIGALTRRLHEDGCREIITTNWRKGSPHETTDYGLAFAADVAWDTKTTRKDFQRRYAKLTFGLDDPAICGIYDTLSFVLPYAEPVQHHMPDYLDRFDLSGLRFPEKWKKYTRSKSEPKVLQRLTHGLQASQKADKLLSGARPKATRGRRHLKVLGLSAECIGAKSAWALALHEGRRLERNGRDTRRTAQWLREYPSILRAWRTARARHRAVLTESGFAPTVKFLNELMFEPAEATAMKKMARRLARTGRARDAAERRGGRVWRCLAAGLVCGPRDLRVLAGRPVPPSFWEGAGETQGNRPGHGPRRMPAGDDPSAA